MALEAIRDNKALAELVKQYDVHPSPITDWKNQMIKHAARVFGGGEAAAEPKADLKKPHAKIGQQALEIVFGLRRSALWRATFLGHQLPE